MTSTALILVILAAFIHASWNLLTKKAAKAGAAFVLAYSVFATLFYAPWVVYLIATGAMNWTWEAVGFILLSTVLHLLYSLCLQTGYAKADLSVVYPVARGTGPLLSSLVAVFLLGEMMTSQTGAGLVLVVGGILLIATQGNFRAFLSPSGREGVGWGMATGGMIAGYTVVDAYAVRVIGTAPVILDWFNNILRAAILLPVVLSDRQKAAEAMRGHWGAAILVGLLSPASYILVLTALEMGAPVTIVAPLRETSMMVGALMGLFILREKVGPWRIVGCVVLAGGAALLASA